MNFGKTLIQPIIPSPSPNHEGRAWSLSRASQPVVQAENSSRGSKQVLHARKKGWKMLPGTTQDRFLYHWLSLWLSFRNENHESSRGDTALLFHGLFDHRNYPPPCFSQHTYEHLPTQTFLEPSLRNIGQQSPRSLQFPIICGFINHYFFNVLLKTTFLLC